MKVVSIVGARPQFIKAAMLSRVLRRNHGETLVHTGQHYDDLMSDIFFRELGLPAPDRNLGVGSGSHGAQTARMLEALEAAFVEAQPDLVIVYGDTNSTLAGALAAAKLGLPVAHVEAGLRSGVKTMPEEINRVVADHVATWLFCPTANAVAQLAREGIESGVHVVGDLMYDALVAFLPRVEAEAPAIYKRYGVEAGGYFLATVHRAANTDDAAVLTALLEAFGELPAPVIFPVHPRTRAALDAASITVVPNVRPVEPVGYIEMLALERGARAVLTDSGGVQREAYFLGVPCVTLREESEWPETLTDGWNVLAGADEAKIVAAAQRPRPAAGVRKAFGDGHAAENIVEILERDPRNSGRPS
jgi:UDP-N-acetylglucosamine 2-epimerase